MSLSITVELKDGTKREFPHVPRAGGSYTNSIRYEGAFVIVRGSYGEETAIPATDVREVRTQQGGGY